MSKIIPISKDFQNQLNAYINALTKIQEYNIPVTYEMGTKYVRVFIGKYSMRKIHSFLDFSGNIYRPLSDDAPYTKMIIGSIYDDNYSIGKSVDQFGIIIQ